MMATWITRYLLLLSCFTLPSGHSIKKRSIVQLSSMVETVTGRMAIDFNDYGNYCGLGGSGIPVDTIDQCCMEHDTCYEYTNYVCLNLFNSRPYFSNYNWSYNGHAIICEKNNLCRQMLCHCDRKAAFCFAKNIADYNPQHLTFWGKLLRMLSHF